MRSFSPIKRAVIVSTTLLRPSQAWIDCLRSLVLAWFRDQVRQACNEYQGCRHQSFGSPEQVCCMCTVRSIDTISHRVLAIGVWAFGRCVKIFLFLSIETTVWRAGKTIEHGKKFAGRSVDGQPHESGRGEFWGTGAAADCPNAETQATVMRRIPAPREGRPCAQRVTHVQELKSRRHPTEGGTP